MEDNMEVTSDWKIKEYSLETKVEHLCNENSNVQEENYQ